MPNRLYTDEHGYCLFDALLDAYDRWLREVPHLAGGTDTGVYGNNDTAMVDIVGPALATLRVRLCAGHHPELAETLLTRFKAAREYAEELDAYCESDAFNYSAWEFGRVETWRGGGRDGE